MFLHISHVNNFFFFKICHRANFDLSPKFWVRCQFLKAIQNYPLFLNKNFKDSDIRKSISYVKLGDHTTPTQSNKNRRLANIEKYTRALVLFFLIPSGIIWVPIQHNRFHSLIFIYYWFCLIAMQSKYKMLQIRTVIFYQHFVVV